MKHIIMELYKDHIIIDNKLYYEDEMNRKFATFFNENKRVITHNYIYHFKSIRINFEVYGIAIGVRRNKRLKF